ncbi:MAG: hypothetical protein K6A77_11520 [Clostridiales bacterium]|nr:hypothetical protein [Clostridiales bacterium]
MTEEESRIYQEISKKFKELVDQDKVIQSLAEKIANGKATYQDAWDYANRIGKAGSKAMLSQVDELVADGIDGYESIMESLYECYDASATYAVAVQTIQNQKAGIGIKGLQTDFDKDRASGIAHLGSNAEDAASAARYLGTPVEHFTENVVGDTIKVNEAFQYQSGLNPKIKRTSTGKCCQWCDEIAGIYDYPAPDEVYRRHQNCNCLVEYYPGNGLKQNAHSKRWAEENYAERERRIEFSNQQGDNETSRKLLGVAKPSYDNPNVNLEYIRSQEYRMKYHGISGDDEVDDRILEEAKKILEERSGTKMETIVLVDAKSGKRLYRFEETRAENLVGQYPDEMKAIIKEYHKEGKSLIALHNHPDGYPPTADDAVSALRNHYEKSVVCGHNGVVYVVKQAPALYSLEECNVIHKEIVDQCINTVDVDKIWQKIFNQYGLSYEKR